MVRIEAVFAWITRRLVAHNPSLAIFEVAVFLRYQPHLESPPSFRVR
jgi:hypothetical protein